MKGAFDAPCLKLILKPCWYPWTWIAECRGRLIGKLHSSTSTQDSDTLLRLMGEAPNTWHLRAKEGDITGGHCKVVLRSAFGGTGMLWNTARLTQNSLTSPSWPWVGLHAQSTTISSEDHINHILWDFCKNEASRSFVCKVLKPFKCPCATHTLTHFS